jgi:hypothetical protein
MKQASNIYAMFPQTKPQTLREVHNWHKELLRSCLYFEFKKHAIKAAIAALNAQIEHHVNIDKDGLPIPARMALEQLNRAKTEFIAELQDLKGAVDVIHDTNEMIIASLISAQVGESIVQRICPSQPHPESNLLHGDGWMFEVLSAIEVEKDGYVGFVTFGTFFDPAGFDVVAFSDPERSVTLKIAWPPERPTAPNTALEPTATAP